MRYDLAIIGGGAAGLRAAYTAHDAGLAVLLFEQAAMGGGVNTSGHYAIERALKHLERGSAYTALTAGLREAAEQYGAATRHHLTSREICVIEEPAVLRGPTGEGFTLRSLDEDFEAMSVLLATGSQPWVPDLPGIDRAIEEGFAVTHHDILGSKKARASAVVLGGSLRGVQMALYYALLGVPSVLLEPPEGLAPELDAEIEDCLGRALEDRGVRREAYVSLESAGQGRVVYVTPGGEKKTLETNALVLGARRVPSTRGLGLASIGAVMDAGGAIVTDARGRTGLPGLYAAGDCTLRTLTSEGARRLADICVADITGKPLGYTAPLLYAGIFAGGHAVSVGETLESARDKRLRPEAVKLPLPYTANTSGLLKLVGSRNGSRLVGAHIAGEGMEELAAALIPAVEATRRVTDIRLPTGTLTGEIAAEALYRLHQKIKSR